MRSVLPLENRKEDFLSFHLASPGESAVDGCAKMLPSTRPELYDHDEGWQLVPYIGAVPGRSDMDGRSAIFPPAPID
jgi:hypothetical protein